MKRLALYPNGLPPAAVNTAEASKFDRECARCNLHNGVRNVCMKSEGKPGGLMVVGEKPSRLEDTAGKIFFGQHNVRVKRLLEQHWGKAVYFDNAIRCGTGVKKITDKHIAACRTYTARTHAKARPERIICLGTEAAYSVLGRRISTALVRRAYGWAWLDDESKQPIPVFILPNARLAFSNTFSARAFEEDLKWALTSNFEPWFLNAVTYLVKTKEDAIKAAKRLRKCEWYTYDVETFGRMGNKNFRVESATFLADDKDRSYTWTREALNDEGAREELRKLLANKKLRAATQNGKYDDRAMLCYVGAAPEVYYDTRLGRKLLEPAASAKLELLAETVGMGGHKQDAEAATKAVCKELKRIAFPLAPITPGGKKRKPPAPPKFPIDSRVIKELQAGAEPMAFAFGYLEPRLLYRYNARDVWSTREVCIQDTHTLMDHPTISRAWKLVVKDANKAVRKIEHWGIPVDRQAVQDLANYCDQGISDLLGKMRKYTDINPGSPKQLAEFLYDELDLPCAFQTPSGARSTDEAALEGLRKRHPYVDLLLEHRKLAKFASTYARGMLPHIRDDGRIHASFLLDGTETGRLSSQEPNLQNIPRAKGSVLGTMARNCFIAGHPDWELLELDFSQLELRIAAMLSGDKEMIKDFQNGIDIHMFGATEACEIVWGIKRATWDKMTKDERDPYRSQIKTTIFGKLYGKHDSGLAAEFGCPVSTVAKMNRLIWGRYNRVEAFMQECIREARRTGVSWTWWDGARSRVRPIWGIADQDPKRAAHAGRTAGNGPVQGTASDFMTASLWPIVDWIESDCVPCELVSVIHDAALLRCHKSATAEVRYQVNRIMTGHNSMGVPLKTDAKTGPAWGTMSDYKEAA